MRIDLRTAFAVAVVLACACNALTGVSGLTAGEAPDASIEPAPRDAAPAVDAADAAPDRAADAPVEATVDAGPTEVYVSDLPYEVIANGWGPVEKDRSNGEEDAGDGTTIRLRGASYAKGLGAHAVSEIKIALGGAYTTFLADVGVDDECVDAGSVVFRVLADGEERFASALLTPAAPAVPVVVDVAGKQELRLVVETGGDDGSFDHADWANARLRR